MHQLLLWFQAPVTSLLCTSPKSTPFPPLKVGKNWEPCRVASKPCFSRTATQLHVAISRFSPPSDPKHFRHFSPGETTFQWCLKRIQLTGCDVKKTRSFHGMFTISIAYCTILLYEVLVPLNFKFPLPLDSRWGIFYQDGDSFMQNWPKSRIESDRFPYLTAAPLILFAPLRALSRHKKRGNGRDVSKTILLKEASTITQGSLYESMVSHLHLICDQLSINTNYTEVILVGMSKVSWSSWNPCNFTKWCWFS